MAAKEESRLIRFRIFRVSQLFSGKWKYSFEMIGTISLTRSRWLVSFLTDLEPYPYIVAGDKHRIWWCAGHPDTTWQMISHYTGQEKHVFVKSLWQLGQKLRTMRETFTGMIESYVQYKSLQGRQKRQGFIYPECWQSHLLQAFRSKLWERNKNGRTSRTSWTPRGLHSPYFDQPQYRRSFPKMP